ncbi:MAG: hypothetical protein IKG00_09495 [Lachnospiraceae bacterium]|nr:hypothetical protein [Oscillospiraceae bacterium]MBR3310109.1 hypothetical protein [Lachnospiraceae bacterium]
MYHRGNLYLLSNLAPLGMILINSCLLVRYRDSYKPRIRRAYWIYIIAPLLAILIQSFSYGLQFIIFATIGAELNMAKAIQAS